MDSLAIIGGGVAGLCAAIRLTELGFSPIVIEAGTYPSHKVCGEFFSPECLSILQRWQIHPTPLYRLHWHTLTQNLDFCFTPAAGSLSHLEFDPALVHYARCQGAEIRTHTYVKAFRPQDIHTKWHEIELSTGEILRVNTVVIATGRLPCLYPKPPNMQYLGIKAHFEEIALENALEMFSFSGAYLGICPVEKGKYNIACLAQLKETKKWSSPDLFMENLIQQHPRLNAYLKTSKRLFPNWMHTPIPAFGIKQTPNWPSAYFIGDAAGTIPPALGGGLSMAITSGCLAAEYILKNDPIGFKKAWHAQYAPSIYCGHLFHRAMLMPTLGNGVISLGRSFPKLAQSLFHKIKNR